MALLTQPLLIHSMLLNNRLVMPPMATAKADAEGMITLAILDYYDEKSRGGSIGLIIVEHSYIAPQGKAGPIQMSVADDACLPGLRELAATIQGNGSKAAMQLNHAGCSTTQEIIGVQPAGPSAVPHPRSGKLCRELSKAEIVSLIDDFAQAARRTRDAGFDAVEIHSAHGYLLNQFYSPLTNLRQDEFGGDSNRRIELHLRVIKAVRRAVGDDYPILLRLGALDYMDGGSTLADCLTAVCAFTAAGVDILDISGGFAGFDIPGLPKQGFFQDVTAAVKKEVKIPVILTGGITEATAAEQLLQDGKADLIGVGRAIMKDSNWAAKALAELTSFA